MGTNSSCSNWFFIEEKINKNTNANKPRRPKIRCPLICPLIIKSPCPPNYCPSTSLSPNLLTPRLSWLLRPLPIVLYQPCCRQFHPPKTENMASFQSLSSAKPSRPRARCQINCFSVISARPRLSKDSYVQPSQPRMPSTVNDPEIID